ncbi:hypothetical protein LTR56_026424 [Elasticomyces elasticus]|nr:hypothetical protein LTR56_026424 [Elasticomyces elasticus]
MPANIFIVGPQCTGKTTLVLALENHLTSSGVTDEPLAVIHEIVRDVMSSSGLSAHNFGSCEWHRLQWLTLQAQCFAEKELDGRWFVSDRSGIDPVVYAQLNGHNDGDLRDTSHWKACRQRMQDGLVILCEAGNMAWLSSDAVRLRYNDSADWEALNGHFSTLLEEEDIRFNVLRKSVVCMKERLDFVVAKLILNGKSKLSVTKGVPMGQKSDQEWISRE